jgi:hypothetical protein
MNDEIEVSAAEFEIGLCHNLQLKRRVVLYFVRIEDSSLPWSRSTQLKIKVKKQKLQAL